MAPPSPNTFCFHGCHARGGVGLSTRRSRMVQKSSRHSSRQDQASRPSTSGVPAEAMVLEGLNSAEVAWRSAEAQAVDAYVRRKSASQLGRGQAGHGSYASQVRQSGPWRMLAASRLCRAHAHSVARSTLAAGLRRASPDTGLVNDSGSSAMPRRDDEERGDESSHAGYAPPMLARDTGELGHRDVAHRGPLMHRPISRFALAAGAVAALLGATPGARAEPPSAEAIVDAFEARACRCARTVRVTQRAPAPPATSLPRPRERGSPSHLCSTGSGCRP